MKKTLAILVCKLLRLLGKLMGKGSSLPGKYALKICPNILSLLRLPPLIIAVTGSNGKTSTVEMIASILRGSGKTVVYNEEGANQIEGVATLVLSCATLGGKVGADVLLIESDERYAAHSFRYFRPTHFVITNLYRDQLTRNGHPEWVYEAIKPAIYPETTLVLNADDPLVAKFAKDRENVKWFGLDACSVSGKEHRGMYDDGARCPVCRGKMEYACYHYNHIGHYRCTTCDYARPETDFTVTAVDLSKGKITIDEKETIQLAFSSIYNVYNILAAYSVCTLAGVESACIAAIINNYILKNGRMRRFRLGAHHGILLTSKHENSVAYDTNLRYIAATKAPCTVVVIVDAVSRKYFTSETSWLWDIDFDQLHCEQVQQVILSGRYVNDLAARFQYTDLDWERVAIIPDIHTVSATLKERGEEDLYVVTCFSDRDKLLCDTQEEAE